MNAESVSKLNVILMDVDGDDTADDTEDNMEDDVVSTSFTTTALIPVIWLYMYWTKTCYVYRDQGENNILIESPSKFIDQDMSLTTYGPYGSPGILLIPHILILHLE